MGRKIYNRDAMRNLGIKIPNGTMLRWEKQGKWPARIRLSSRCVAWYADEIDDHIASLATTRATPDTRTSFARPLDINRITHPAISDSRLDTTEFFHFAADHELVAEDIRPLLSGGKLLITHACSKATNLDDKESERS